MNKLTTKSVTKTTIKARIMSAIILCMFVGSLLIAVSASFIIYNISINNAENEVVEKASAYSTAVEKSMGKIRTQLSIVSRDGKIYDESLSVEERLKILSTYVPDTEFKDFSVAYSNGKTYSGTDLSERDYFKSAINGTAFISSPLIRKTDGSLTIMAGGKSKNPEYDSVLYGGIDYDYFNKMINEIKFGKSGHGYIIDKKGTIIAHPDVNYVQEFVNPSELAKTDASYEELGEYLTSALNNENGSGSGFYTFNGIKMFAVYSKIEGPEGWILVLTEPYSDVTAVLVQSIILLSVITVIVCIVAAIVAGAIAHKISKPINKYTERLKNFSEGDMHSPTEIEKTGDELEVLGNSLSNAMNTLVSCVNDVSDIMKNISHGNLIVSTKADYIGDLDELKQSADNIITSLREIMYDINNSSSQVSTGAEQVAQGAQALSQGAVTQASTVQELSATIGNISEKVVSNAKNAKQANISSEKSSQLIENGNQQMQTLMTAMEEINSSSSQIANIIKSIDDIAFQTNILALNAAVEAARAGVAGKGFAVVAEEVRNLAAKSAEAAKTTADLIESSIKAVENGTKIAKNTAETLQEIVENSAETSRLIENIAEASEQQANEIKEITDGVDQISGVVQTNSATSEQSAAAAEELSSQSNMLTQMVKKFKF